MREDIERYKIVSPNEAEKEENQTKVFNAIYTYYSQALDKRDKPKLSIGSNS